VDGNDVVAVYRAVAKAVERARRGEGPSLVEAKTYRLVGFSTSDMGGYQPDEEIENWRARDPIARTGTALSESLGAARVEEAAHAARTRVEQAFERAMSDPLPAFEPFAGSRPYATAAERS